MNTVITIIHLSFDKDEDGFSKTGETVLASVRAYKENRNSTEKWTNRAVLQDASAIFRFRFIPGVEVTTDMVIDCFDGRYNITSVENVRDKNRYLEIVGKREAARNG